MREGSKEGGSGRGRRPEERKERKRKGNRFSGQDVNCVETLLALREAMSRTGVVPQCKGGVVGASVGIVSTKDLGGKGAVDEVVTACLLAILFPLLWVPIKSYT